MPGALQAVLVLSVLWSSLALLLVFRRMAKLEYEWEHLHRPSWPLRGWRPAEPPPVLFGEVPVAAGGSFVFVLGSDGPLFLPAVAAAAAAANRHGLHLVVRTSELDDAQGHVAQQIRQIDEFVAPRIPTILGPARPGLLAGPGTVVTGIVRDGRLRTAGTGLVSPADIENLFEVFLPRPALTEG